MEDARTPATRRVAVALNLVADELRSAMAKFPPFNTAHEGYAVLLEEVDELWHEVKHGTPERARAEAMQVAAMALRFLVDIPAGTAAERDFSTATRVRNVATGALYVRMGVDSWVDSRFNPRGKVEAVTTAQLESLPEMQAEEDVTAATP